MMPFAFIFLMLACFFAWCALSGLRTGSTYIPLILFRDDQYARGEPGFRLAILVNVIGATGSAATALAIWAAW